MTWLLPPRLFLICLLAMIGMDQLLPVRDAIIPPWNWIGLGIAGAGAFLTLSSAMRFRRLETNIVTFDDPECIVDTGFFAFSRNPMYLGFTLALLGVAIFLGSPMPFLMVLMFFLAADRWYIPFEEERMRAIFGKAYADYCSRVRRWI